MSLVTVSSDVMQEPAVDQIGRVITQSLQGSYGTTTHQTNEKKFTNNANTSLYKMLE